MKNIASMAMTVVLTTSCLIACGNGGPDYEPVSNEARVSITNFSEDCQTTRCWLLTQFERQLVSDQSVSLFDEWPMDDDTVRLLCMDSSDIPYRDTRGEDVYWWYGILVPEDKATPEAHDGIEPEAIRVEGGYIGFVGISWIRQDDVRTPYVPPRCPTQQ